MTRITDYVHEYAAAAPDREAVVFGEERITYRELYKAPKRFHIRESLPRLPVGKIDKKALARETREDM